MKIIAKFKDNIYGSFLVLIIFIALFSTKILSFFLIGLLLLWIFKFKDFSNFRRCLKWVSPFIIYALIILTGFLFSDNYAISVKILERNTSFVLLPFIIFCKKWKKTELDFFSFLFVRITLLIALFSIFNLIYFYLTHIDFVKSMDDTYLQWKLPHLSGFHPTYFGFLIVIATIILFRDLLEKLVLKSFKFYSAIFLGLYLLYLSPRTAVICLLIVWFYFFYHYVKSEKYKRIYVFTILTITALSIVVLAFNSQYLVDKVLKSLSDRRFLLWNEAFSVIKENYFLFGEGLGNGEVLMKDFIHTNQLKEFTVVDLHNQYLMNYLDIGILGFIAIFWMLFKPLNFLKDKTLFLFIIVFCFSIFTESYLYVIKGIIFFIILFSYFILSSKNFELDENL